MSSLFNVIFTVFSRHDRRGDTWHNEAICSPVQGWNVLSGNHSPKMDILISPARVLRTSESDALRWPACGHQQVAIYARSYGDSVPTTCGEVLNDGG